ncbi:MAG: hypothetical protein V4535_08490 [Bacteroidota bacterium]
MSKFNEEEIRSKIVVPILTEAGYSFNDLEFETSFSIQLGRGVYNIKNQLREFIGGRLDILCKADSVNIFLIELKAENVDINVESDSRQGLSYARLLNPMPPYVIVTNSKETYIYETITGEEVDKSHVQKNGFHISIDSEINLRYEALKSFVGYSLDNLKIFCSTFNGKYIENFKSSAIDSLEESLQKKYIPEIYVQRSEIVNSFKDFLQDSNAFIFPIIGESGVGKTNAIINLCEVFQEYPSIFYSGTLLGNSFFDELKFDFNLEFSPNETELSLLRKISALTISTDKPFVIYLDALDEWITEDASKQLENLTKILVRYKIKLCVSCKDLLWSNFLIQREIPTLFSKHLFTEFHLDNFNESELLIALNNYSRKYNLEVNYKKITSELFNPFSLRIACEVSFEKKLPLDLSQNDRETLHTFIAQKLHKTNIAEKLERFLISIAQVLYNKDAVQVSELTIRHELNLSLYEEIPPELFSLNFLYRSHIPAQSETFIGFYFSKIRDYIISINLLKLNVKKSPERIEIISESASSYIGENAVNYFLKTGLSEEIEDCVIGLTRYDHYNLKGSLLKLLAQQDLSFIDTIKENIIELILDHILFTISAIKNDIIIGKEIMQVLIKLSERKNLDDFLIKLLLILNTHHANGYDISYDISRILMKYDKPESTAKLKEMLLNPDFDGRIRRFIIDPIRHRKGENLREIYLALLNLRIHGKEKESVLFYANSWYSRIEDDELRDIIINHFDNSKDSSLQYLLLHPLMHSTLKDTGEILFERFINSKFSENVTDWLCRAICSNNYRPAIPKFIELLVANPSSSLSNHILIGLGEMQAKETMPALLQIIENLDEKVDTWWLSMAFLNIATETDYKKLEQILYKTKNKRSFFLSVLTLSQVRLKKYYDIIINSLQEDRLSIKEKVSIISTWAHSLTSSWNKTYSIVEEITDKDAKNKFNDDQLEKLYILAESNTEVSIFALGILMNFDISSSRLSDKIMKILPTLVFNLETNQVTLVNEELIKKISFVLNPWLQEQLTLTNWDNKNFLYNCIQLAGIFGDHRVLESIRANRNILTSSHKYGDKFIDFIEHTIRTSGSKLRLRLDY